MSRPKSTRPATYDIEYVRAAAVRQWPAILTALGGIDPDLLDGQHHPCPKCGGTDRFRLIDADAGACLCNQCFSTGNGDGFAALQWATGWKFAEALKAVAEYLGIQPSESPRPSGGPGRGPAAKPDEHLVFEPWDAGNEMLAAAWCVWKEPINVAAIKAVGGRIARYRQQYLVIALPVWGKLLDATAPVGWVIYNLAGGNLPKYAKNSATGKWEISEWVKVKLTAGSQPGVIADLGRLRKARVAIKVEGPSDLLGLLSLADLPDDHAGLTNANGAGERPADWVVDLFASKDEAWVIHDADQPGQAGAIGKTDEKSGQFRPGWANCIAERIPVRNVVLPFPVVETHGQDLRDYLNQEPKPSFADLQALAAAAEVITGGAVAENTANRPDAVIWNTIEQIIEGESGEKKKQISPLTMREVKDLICKVTNDFPRRTDSALFVDDPQHGIAWLQNSAAMFGWLCNSTGIVEWRRSVGAVTKEEIFHEYRRSAPNYAAVESLPHEPLRTDHYYTCKPVEPGRGEFLEDFLDKFSPETDIDRDLIQAMLATVLWGGSGGMRPCFVITTNDGPGSGKTTLVRMIANIFGGFLSFDRGEQVAEIKTRLLSPEALTKRICLIDNVKSPKWSWGEFEGLITSSIISGKRMYLGEGSRPNTITWCLTLNGANLSTDMAQRSVIIKLKRPTNSGAWEEETRSFVEAYRMEIIADLIGMLRREPHSFERFTRWADWESAVLARVPNPAVAQQAIIDRQGTVDAEQEENEEIEENFATELRRLEYDVVEERIFIPSRICAQWFNRLINERMTPTAVTRTLRQMIKEGRFSSLMENHHKGNGRGFIWAGVKSFAAGIKIDIEKRISEKYAQKENKSENF